MLKKFGGKLSMLNREKGDIGKNQTEFRQKLPL